MPFLSFKGRTHAYLLKRPITHEKKQICLIDLLTKFTILYFLISANVAQIVHPIAELVIPIGIWIKETKAKIETYPLPEEANIRKCLI